MAGRPERRLGLALGVRWGLARGWRGWPMVAVGVGAVVFVVLLASGLVGVADRRIDRVRGRTPAPATVEGQPAFGLAREVRDFDGGSEITRMLVAGFSGVAPPGVDRMPGPGECRVSPALAKRLGEAPELAARYCDGHVNLIGPEGLADTAELFAYVGVDRGVIEGRAGTVEVVGFGSGTVAGHIEESSVALLRRVALGATVVLLAPLWLLIVSAAGMAASAREQRIAGIRLIGASQTTARAAIAGEVLIGALVGTLGAGLGFALVRRNLDGSSIAGLVWRTDDATVGWIPVLTVAVVLWLAARLPAWSGRFAIVAPLHARRAAPPARRGSGWGILPLAVGVSGLAVVDIVGNDPPLDTDHVFVPIAFSAAALATVGIGLALPTLSRALGRLMASRGRSIGLLIAGRRLEVDERTAVRPATGVALVVMLAGIVLFVLRITALAGIEYLLATVDTPGGRSVVVDAPREAVGDLDLEALPGVESVVALTLVDPGGLIGSCEDVEVLTGGTIPGCRPGVPYRIAYERDPPTVPEPGRDVELEGVDPDTGAAVRVVVDVPPVIATVPRLGGDLGIRPAVVIPPELAEGADAVPVTTLVVVTDGTVSAEQEVRAAVAAAGPAATVRNTRTTIARGLAATGRVTGIVTLVALVAVVALAAALAMQTLDAIDHPRRTSASLLLAGTPTSTLRAAQAVEAATPLAAGVSTALVVLLLLNVAQSRAVGIPVDLDGAVLGLVAGGGIAATALLTLVARRGTPPSIRPETLRTE